MSIFEFRCPDADCGYTEDCIALSSSAAEVLHRYPPKCGRCGKAMVRRVTAASLRFNGQGWQTPSPSGGGQGR